MDQAPLGSLARNASTPPRANYAQLPSVVATIYRHLYVNKPVGDRLHVAILLALAGAFARRQRVCVIRGSIEKVWQSALQWCETGGTVAQDFTAKTTVHPCACNGWGGCSPFT